MSYYSILETKIGNDNLWNPEFMVLKEGYNCHVRPKKFQFMEKGQNRNFDYKIIISVKNP